MLEEEEGRVRHAYLDSKGYWTIGVGRLIDGRLGGGLSNSEIDFLLSNDIAEKTREVLAKLPWAAGLNEPRRAVLIGMAFQMGIDGLLGFKATLRAVEDEHWSDAAEHMRQSLWAKQTPARARRMAHQMESGEWQ